MNHSDEQERFLDEALSSVRQRAIQMEHFLEKRNLVDAIHVASDMLQQMMTHLLSPKSYYELYIAVTDKLRVLETFLIEEHRNGRKVLYLYETVQYIASIIPRLYLLITVGVYYIKCSELSRRDIIRDLVDMCSGVQHPIRGLFLRSYLVHSLRSDLLPDIEDNFLASLPSNVPESEQSVVMKEENETTNSNQLVQPTNQQGTITDSIEFLLLNFAEMNKLWVRMQHQGHSRDRERREMERRELRLLVGTNLNRLSQLEAINVERYKIQILPRILEQIIECRDVIAQEYLMDVIIQVFPDEFHMSTLPMLLRTCGQLQPGVKLKHIICSLIDRLSQYSLSELAAGRKLKIPNTSVHPTTTTTTANGDLTNGDSQSNTTTTINHKSDNLENSPHESESQNPDPNQAKSPDLFSLFFREVDSLIQSRLNLCDLTCIDPIPTGLGTGRSRHAGGLGHSMSTNGLPLEDVPAIYTALVYLAMVLHPDNTVPLVDACLNATADALTQIGLAVIPSGSRLASDLLPLLHTPLDGSAPCTGTGIRRPSAPLGALGELRTVLTMTGFRRLVSLLDPKTLKCRLAYHLLAGALEREQQNQLTKKDSKGVALYSARLTTEQDLDSLFELIDGLLTTDIGACDDPDEFTEAQGLVAGMLHLLGPNPKSLDPDMCFKLFLKAQARLGQAGPAVIRFNFPALVFQGLQLAQTYWNLHESDSEWDEKVEKIIEFCHRCCTALVAADAPELALRLFLHSALVMDRIPFGKQESMTYEFLSQALTLYEEGVSESRNQIDAISLITSTLCQMRCFTEENRRTLRTQCSRAAAHLLRKPDQCRAVAASAHLFWPTQPLGRNQNVEHCVQFAITGTHPDLAKAESCEEIRISEEELEKLRDPQSVLSCLDRAARLARDCMDISVKSQLFIELLNTAVNLRLSGCTAIPDQKLNDYIKEIKSLLSGLESNPTSEHIMLYFMNTLDFIQQQRHQAKDSSNPDLSKDLFAEVNLE